MVGSEVLDVVGEGAVERYFEEAGHQLRSAGAINIHLDSRVVNLA